MKLYLLGATVVGALLTISAPAQARDGCGQGFYRGPHGNCHPEGYHPGPGPAPVAYVDGHYYHGHGYYYHNRWYHERYHWHDGSWRYR